MATLPRSRISSIVLCALLAAHTAAATTMAQLDTRALTLQSSDIVIGTVEQVHSYWNPAHTRILTDVTVAVSRSLVGEAADRITLTQYGGEVDGVRVSVPGCPSFRTGEEALLFVWRDPRGVAQVNGLAQGKFDIARDAATGEMLVQRRTPGFAVRDVKTLGRVAQGQAAPALRLDALVREIRHTLDATDR